MANKSMSDALLNRDKDYRYSTMLPIKYRESMDVDQLDTDYMRGDMSPAVPSIIADTYNSLIESGQMMTGDRELDPGKLFMNTLDFAPGALAVGRLAPVRGGTVLGANVFQGGPHKYGPEGAAKSLSHVGEGEGATAYGWGRYDADSEGVGRSYQNQAPKSRWDLPGHLYKHDLPDEDIARYLDWDKPLSEQPEIFGTLKNHWNQTLGDPDIIMQRLELTDNSTGRELYTALAGLGDNKQGASEALGKIGIPGLKYKDAVSRNKTGTADDIRVKLWPDGKYEVRAYDKSGKKYGEWYDQTPADMEKLIGKDLAGEAVARTEGSSGMQYLDGSVDFQGTRNYVTWDQGVLDRMKLLERDGESMVDALRGTTPRLDPIPSSLYKHGDFD
jgi:hypothetical protein